MTETTITILIVGYLLPTVIACCRSHHNAGAIFVVNLALGWTFLGWLAALVWACTNQAPVSRTSESYDGGRIRCHRDR